MGDRTTVNLTVLLEHADTVRNLCEAEECDNKVHAVFTYYEVNYGNLDFLKELRNAGIAYTSEWDSGSEFGSGAEYCRFTKEGEIRQSEIYDEDRSIPVVDLMNLLDKTNELKELILDRNEALQVLPLDKNQIQYGKLYLAKKLIGATS